MCLFFNTFNEKKEKRKLTPTTIPFKTQEAFKQDFPGPEDLLLDLPGRI